MGINDFWHDVRKISRRYEVDWLTAGIIAGLIAIVVAGVYYSKNLIKKKYAKH